MAIENFGRPLVGGTYYDYSINHASNEGNVFEKHESDFLLGNLSRKYHSRIGTNLPHPFDVGGNFLLKRRRQLHEPVFVDCRNAKNGQRRFVGNVYSTSLPDLAWVAKDLRPYGPTAYARMKPTKPAFDFGMQIAELRDLPSAIRSMFRQRMRRSRTYRDHARNFGQSYLEWAFGWIPLYGALLDLLDLKETVERRLEFLLRKDDKPIRTKTQLHADESETPVIGESGYGYLSHIGPTSMYSSEPRRFRSQKSEEIIWASARWLFHFPRYVRDPYTGRLIPVRKALARSLAGFFVSPTTIYNLTPWSWLADYFTNLGDVVEATTGDLFDSCLVAKSVYVMGHKRTTYSQYTKVDLCHVNGSIFTVRPSVKVISEEKQRIRGSLWGFGLLESDLSLSQRAILASLGLSKLP